MTNDVTVAAEPDESPKLGDIIETLRYLYDKLQDLRTNRMIGIGCTNLQTAILFFEESERVN
jgi:hypothetical protein